MPERSVKLTIYNHKGGVGKTTLTVNIAAALAEQGATVLLIDSDPQCNLTAYFFDDEFVNGLLDESDGDKGRTAWSAVKPVVEGTGNVRVIRPFSTVVPNLYLLPGDIRLSEFEQALNDAWIDCFKRKPSGFRGVFALSFLVSAVANRVKADYVMYDTGPNIGPLNRVILLDTDYYIVPVACDLFSVRALATLGQTLKSWIIDWKTISTLAPDEIDLLRGRPRFLGYIPQRFKVYGRRMARTPQYYLGRVRKQLYSDLISVLREIDGDLAPGSVSETELGQVKDFGTLVQSAQREGVPLSQVSDGSPQQKQEALSVFGGIALRILEKTSLVSQDKKKPEERTAATPSR